LRTLWTQAHPKVETKRHRLHDVTFSPMPLQKPRPPLYVGGNSEGALRRVARLGDGWHATATNVEAFGQGADTVRRFWKDAGREGEPALSLRIPILIDGVHRAAVDMGLIRGRHVIGGPVAKIVEELRGYQALGCQHIALEVSYSTYPAILETIDIIAERLRPPVAG
jgi:alkanesulfonate monooxygenase SsuD/methylene tetrahydromethanopterin reductase-like flavin-dependent oxidoreductase (luciferase family)